jgi:soluble lytic murein transglycosylase-like protein
MFWRLTLIAFFALRVLGQSSQPTAPIPALSAPDSAIKAQPDAATAMRESILRQKRAVLAGQQKAQQGSLAQQKASLRLQHQDAIPSVPGAPLGTAQSTLGSSSDDFFSTRWEPGTPVAMPNVRVPTTACPALADEEVDKLTKLAAGKNAIPAALIRAVMKQESAFHPCAVSTAGAMGLMQIMPGTAETLGLEDAFSPGENVEAGARYLKQLLDRYHGDRRLALGAYNAGPSRVDNSGGIPDIPETIDYVSRILGEVPDDESASLPGETPPAPVEVLAPPTPPTPVTTLAPPTTPSPATPATSPAAPPVPSGSPSTAPAPPPAP